MANESAHDASQVLSASDATGLPRRKQFHGVPCPHCGARAVTRSSRLLSPLYRERTCQCTNPDCGHVYIVGMEVLRTVSPSAAPNPDIHIPMSPHAIDALRRTLESA